MPSAFARSMNQSRLTIALTVFVLCCLLSTGRLVFDSPTPASIAVSSAEIENRSDRRFSVLKAYLPQRGVVGYVGEPGTLAIAGYYLTQYALAPLVVENSQNHALVIGNFPASPPAFTPENLHLVKDFGDGVLLYAGSSAQNGTSDVNKDAK
jgi:hypothetical protein